MCAPARSLQLPGPRLANANPWRFAVTDFHRLEPKPGPLALVESHDRFLGV